MSDMTGGGADFQQLYQQVLQQYPRSKGKTASPQKDLQAALSWKKMIDGQLGFDPQTYESPTKQAYSPKSSAVKLQYAKDPQVMDALNKVDSGVPSSTIASVLIDPSTGEVTQDAQNQGFTTASATAAVKASQDYEKEQATNGAAQADYEARQAADPTYGRTKGSTNGKQVLPEGSLTGTETPDFTYAQGIQDMLNGLSSTNGKVSLPMAPPTFGHPAAQVGQIATAPNPLGGMAVDTSIHGRTPMAPSPQEAFTGATTSSLPALAAGQGRTMTPIMSPATGTFAHHPLGNPFAALAQGARRLVPTVGPSAQERAVSGVSAMQDFANKYAQPVRSQANNAAVQKLMQVIALQG